MLLFRVHSPGLIFQLKASALHIPQRLLKCRQEFVSFTSKVGEGKDKPQNPSPSSVIVCGVAHINFELLQQILPRHHHLRLLTRRKKNSLVKSFNGREHSLEVLGKFTHTLIHKQQQHRKKPTFVQIRVGRFPGCVGCAKWMFYFLSVYFFYKFLFGTRFALVQMIRLFN